MLTRVGSLMRGAFLSCTAIAALGFGGAPLSAQPDTLEEFDECGRRGFDAICIVEAMREVSDLVESESWAEADHLLGLVETRARRAGGIPHAIELNIQAFRAAVLHGLERYDEAEARLAPIRREMDSAFGRRNPLTANVLTISGDVAMQQRRYRNAADYYRRALPIMEESSYFPPVSLYAVRLDLAMSLAEIGRLSEAQPHLDAVLAGEGRGATARQIVVARATLARSLRNRGRLQDAEGQLQIALRAAVPEYGERHRNTAALHAELGLVQTYLHKWEAGEISLRTALGIRRELFPPLSVEIANSALALSCAVYSPEERLALRREALNIYRRLRGERDPGTGVAYLEVARSLSEFGRLDEARDYGLHGFAILQRRGLEYRGPAVAGSHVTLGAVMRRRDDLPAAEGLLRRGFLLEQSQSEVSTHSQLYTQALVAGVWLQRGTHPVEAYAMFARIMPQLIAPVAEQAVTSINLTNEMMVYRPQLLEQVQAAWAASQALSGTGEGRRSR